MDLNKEHVMRGRTSTTFRSNRLRRWRKPYMRNSGSCQIRDEILQWIVPSACFVAGYPVETLQGTEITIKNKNTLSVLEGRNGWFLFLPGTTRQKKLWRRRKKDRDWGTRIKRENSCLCLKGLLVFGLLIKMTLIVELAKKTKKWAENEPLDAYRMDN